MADGITLPTAIGRGDGITEYHGTFIHTMGAAECTFKIGNARVLSVHVYNMDTTPLASPHHSAQFSESVSGGTNTVTVHILDTVADGRITVVAKA